MVMEKNVRPLTKRQKQILDFIDSTIQKAGHPPTLREMGKRFGIKSTNGVRTFLIALEKKGYIKKAPYRSRGIYMADQLKAAWRPVPVVGKIAAGLPITAIENIESSIAIDKTFLPGDGVFSLKVTGESMKNAGIFDGDYVLVQQQATANPGDIVVAIIGEEATVKRFYPEKGHVRLMPENPDFSPLIVEKNTPGFSLAGKVVGVMRRL